MRGCTYAAMTLYTLTSICISSLPFATHFLRSSQREFVVKLRAFLVGYHAVYSNTYYCVSLVGVKG